MVLYTFWSYLLRSQFHSATYILFRDLALEDYRNGDQSGIDILDQLFHFRASSTENEMENLEFVKERERLKQVTVKESDLVAVGH